MMVIVYCTICTYNCEYVNMDISGLFLSPPVLNLLGFLNYSLALISINVNIKVVCFSLQMEKLKWGLFARKMKRELFIILRGKNNFASLVRESKQIGGGM
jgi:hypothetical protein